MMTLTDRMNTGEAVHFLREWGGGEWPLVSSFEIVERLV